MQIKNLYKNKKPVISFEIFPPKKDGPIDTIYHTIDALKDLKPDFISVTYGAGGNTVNKTVEIASIIKNIYHIESLAHLTCVTSTKEEIENILSQLKHMNVENILALRGDFPKDPNFKFPDPLHYQYAKDLVTHIQSKNNFSIGAACYPEGHIGCDCLDKDLFHLNTKINTGADFLISQLFFDNEIFYSFKEKLNVQNSHIPISAGILPVINKKQIDHIVSLCGCHMPKKFIRIIEKYADKPEALKEAGIAYAVEQIIDLLSWGVDGIHIYTMNRPKTTRKIVESISTIRNVLTEA
ncbi:methylenetetrahydrofolate reductase [NAD(P)H] [Marinisporobacter balticus]|uniref:Methylenetetrahydrofolate reductase n=1 Tax=Marinisporobacter balticus TaxID=2018667 RepID=A0A4R2L3T4_9FIRM|nr:methylenetetrahydrofolate reductase [NAD(P)H] [Marinisporobacter balticus]TCO73785.1 5,10-methylenetetrahydrofolate reductase (NAD(P)) [Marinisporobacter balticus]